MAFMAKQRAQAHYNAGTRILANVGQFSFVDKWREEVAKYPWKRPSPIPKRVKQVQNYIKNLKEAVKHLQKAVELYPSYPYAFHNISDACYWIAEYEVLLASFQGFRLNVEIITPGMWYLNHQADSPQALELNEQQAENVINGSLRLALEAVDRALALRYEFPQAHNTRAIVLARLGRLDEAFAATEIALLQNPGYAKALANRDKMNEMKKWKES